MSDPIPGPAAGRSFEGSVASRRDALRPAERRVVDFIDRNRATALASSALDIAAGAATSDATVVRAIQALGYAGLADLKRALVEAVDRPPTPAEGMRRTLDEVGESTGRALDAVVAAHEEGLAALRGEAFREALAAAVSTLHGCRRIALFGIGPSAALARYAATQLTRSGRRTGVIDATGRMLADQLLGLEAGDGLLAIAYGRVYREVAVTFAEAKRLAVPVVLATDGSLAGVPRLPPADVVLDVPRGRAERTALHGATLVALDALVLGLAAAGRDQAVRALERLDAIRRRVEGDRL